MKRSLFASIRRCPALLLIAAALLFGPRPAAAAVEGSASGEAAVEARARTAVQEGLPAEDVRIIVSRARGRGADAAQVLRMLDAAVGAKRDGLPAGPVLDRIEQGLAKGVPAATIADAAERLARNLREGRPLVEKQVRRGMALAGPRERDSAVAATARALELSLRPADIAALGDAVRSRDGTSGLFVHAVDAAAGLAGQGVPPERAAGIIRQAVEQGRGERGIDALRAAFDDNMRGGMGPAEAVDRAASGLERQERGFDDMRSERPGRERGGGFGGRRR